MSGRKYSLPFRGKPVITVTAPFHKTSPDYKHCVDFFLPKGIPIIAARTGIMTFRESRYSKTFVSEKDADKGNAIVILHTDGEESFYAHIEYHSVKVRVGEKVRRGQMIARSGQTGYAWYPHLHFGVYDKNGKNIKINFAQRPAGRHISLKRAVRLARLST